MSRINALLIALISSGVCFLYPLASSATPLPSATVAVLPLNTGTPIALQKVAQAKPKTAVLALDSEGLRVVNASTGATRALPFGMKEVDVVTIVNNLRGKIRDRGTNSECGAGPLGYASWGDGLTLLFNKGQFAGWSVDGRSQNAKNKLTTIAGIGTGSTRTQLNKAYTAKVFQSTLGTEFSAGNLGGILSGNRPSDRITSLWSGTTCLFR